MKLFVLSLLLWPGPAAALTGDTSFIRAVQEGGRELTQFQRTAEGFYPPGAVPVPIPNAAQVVPALVRLRTSSGGRCSGAFISRRGHVLTALHCLDAGLLTKRVTWNRFGRDVLAHMNAAESYEGSDARTWIHGRFDEGSLTLVAAGRGLGDIDPAHIDLEALRRDPELLAWFRSFEGADWAVLKTRSDGPYPCAPASERVVPLGEVVWTLGFPGPAFRGGGGYSLSMGAKATYGVTKRLTIPETGVRGPISPRAREVIAFVLDGIETDGSAIVTDADSKGGMSGGPIVGRDGMIAGVTTNGDSTFFSFGGIHIGGGIAGIQRAMRSSGLRSQDYFDCR